MGAQLPLVMALDDPGAVPGVVGGKGASLAALSAVDPSDAAAARIGELFAGQPVPGPTAGSSLVM